MLQQRGSMSSCGQSPMDFESMSLANRIHGHIAAEAGSAPSRGEAGRHGDSGGGEGEAEPLRAEPNGFRINVLRHSDTLSMRGRRHARFDPAMPNPTRPGTTRTPARPPAETDRRRQNGFAQSDAQNLTPAPGRRNRSSTSMRLFFNSLRKIFLPCSFAEASSRRQKNGIAQSEVPHPTPAPTRRGRSTTSIRHRTIRSWQSFPRANSPRPIVDFNCLVQWHVSGLGCERSQAQFPEQPLPFMPAPPLARPPSRPPARQPARAPAQGRQSRCAHGVAACCLGLVTWLSLAVRAA